MNVLTTENFFTQYYSKLNRELGNMDVVFAKVEFYVFVLNGTIYIARLLYVRVK